MSIPVCSQCTTKVLRPERCIVALDGKPCSACAEDIELEQEIKRLGRCTDEIHVKRQALRTVMNENHDFLIHKFPPEISSQIFIQYYAIVFTKYNLYARQKLLDLGSVCQKWRQLAWATPELWTSVYVEGQDISGWSNHKEQLLIGWLERSGGLPLTIRFISPFGEAADRLYQAAANVLNKHSAQWQDIHLEIPAQHLHRFCGSSEGNIVRELTLQPPEKSFFPRAYSLQASDGGYVSRFPPFRMKSKVSPRRLALTSVPLICVDISWDNLTTVSLCDIGCGECIELIRRCPRLESIQLKHVITSSITFPNPNNRIHHPRLHSLRILNTNNQTITTQIFDSLCLSALEYWTHCSFFCPLDNMISFIKYSSFRLKEFSMDSRFGDGNTYNQIHILLCHLPSLEDLQLRCPDNYQLPTNEFPDLLCASGESPPFLPRLQTLRFVNLPFTWDFLPRIFASPNRRSLMLNIIHSSPCNVRPDIKSETVKRLLELVEEGFNLSIFKEGQDVLEEYRRPRTLSPIYTSIRDMRRVFGLA